MTAEALIDPHHNHHPCEELLSKSRREKEQELTRGGTTEVSPAMTPWRNSDLTKKPPASAEIAHAAKRCALLPPGVTRNRGASILHAEAGLPSRTPALS
jgi:hypothetical protein